MFRSNVRRLSDHALEVAMNIALVAHHRVCEHDGVRTEAYYGLLSEYTYESDRRAHVGFNASEDEADRLGL